MTLSIGSLFSGIGGLELGLELAGLGTVSWQVEIDPFCRAVLAKHWPQATRFADIREVGAELPPVDLMCGGFPCQDVSRANIKGKSNGGINGPKSGLWSEFARVVGLSRPAWVVVENVAAVSRWLPRVRADLAAAGYHAVPVSVSASGAGLPQERERCFVVASTSYAVAARLACAAREPLAIADRLPQPAGGDPLGPRDGRGVAIPGVVRVVHGLPAGLDRRAVRKADIPRVAALGNSVCPPAARVIGELIRTVLEAA